MALFRKACAVVYRVGAPSFSHFGVCILRKMSLPKACLRSCFSRKAHSGFTREETWKVYLSGLHRCSGSPGDYRPFSTVLAEVEDCSFYCLLGHFDFGLRLHLLGSVPWLRQ